MAVNTEKYQEVLKNIEGKAALVAVSKLRSTAEIKVLYDLGQRDFGENYVQELVAKQSELPQDIRWHFIGHLQTNKVKYIASFVYMVHGVDSIKLLRELDKEAGKNNRTIRCLLQVHIASEETKFGLDEPELKAILNDNGLKDLAHIDIVGLMGMASMTTDDEMINAEFSRLKKLFDEAITNSGMTGFNTLSMGMSADYKQAISLGGNMVRIGSILFGSRPPK